MSVPKNKLSGPPGMERETSRCISEKLAGPKQRPNHSYPITAGKKEDFAGENQSYLAKNLAKEWA